MEIPDANPQINRKLELSKTDQAESPAGREKTEKRVNGYDAVKESAVTKADTVQLTKESLVLANTVKAENGKEIVPIQNDISQNVLVELLNKADGQRGIFGSSEGASKLIEQENRDNKSDSLL